MSLVGITVDACYGCTLAYFDRGEFIYVCNNPVVFITALTPGAASSSSVWDYVNSGADAAETVHLAAHGASAAGEAALQGAEQVSKALVNTDVVTAAGTAGKASVQAAEVLADAGEVAAEAVLEVLAGVFGGF